VITYEEALGQVSVNGMGVMRRPPGPGSSTNRHVQRRSPLQNLRAVGAAQQEPAALPLRVRVAQGSLDPGYNEPMAGKHRMTTSPAVKLTYDDFVHFADDGGGTS